MEYIKPDKLKIVKKNLQEIKLKLFLKFIAHKF